MIFKRQYKIEHSQYLQSDFHSKDCMCGFQSSLMIICTCLWAGSSIVVVGNTCTNHSTCPNISSLNITFLIGAHAIIIKTHIWFTTQAVWYFVDNSGFNSHACSQAEWIHVLLELWLCSMANQHWLNCDAVGVYCQISVWVHFVHRMPTELQIINNYHAFW